MHDAAPVRERELSAVDGTRPWPQQRADLLIEAGLLPCAQAVLRLAGADVSPTHVTDLATAVARAGRRDAVLCAEGDGADHALAECDGSQVPERLRARLRRLLCRAERRRVSQRPAVCLLRARLLRWSADRAEVIVTLSARGGDASSLRALLTDMVQPSSNATAALSFAAIVEWERTSAADEAAEEAADEGRLFWALQTRTREPDREWPYHRPWTPQAASRCESDFVSVDAGFDVDPIAPATLLACWQLLTWRLTGHASTMGVVMPARKYPELEAVIGPLDRTLPYRSTRRPRGALLVQDVVRGVEQWWESASEWQEQFDPAATEDGIGHVYPLGFVYTAWPLADSEILIDTAGAHITLVACDTRDRLTLAIQFHRAVFSRDFAQRVLTAFVNLLADATARPLATIDDLSLLSAAERTQMVGGWNASERTWPADVNVTLHASMPDAIAIRADEEHWTCATLDAHANQLARHLLRLGVGPEVRVGVWLDRSPLWVVAILAIARAGGAYVPLDPSYPAERLAYQMADAGVPLVLTTQAHLTSLPAGGQMVDVIDAPDAAWRTELATPVSEPVLPQQLAYIIYTSGSTGQPKGVMTTSGAQQNHLAWIVSTFELDAEDRVLQTVPMGFDPSLMEVVALLMVGGTVVIAPAHGPRDPAWLCRAIQDHGISMLQVVPSMLAALVDEPELSRCVSLRVLIVGGEALSGALLSRVQSRAWPALRLANLYGPTETAVDATWHACVSADADAAIVSIGRPLPNTAAFIVDHTGQPLPPGMAGDLLIGGAQVGRGYWGQPALTADRFVPDPFSGRPGTRLYRTGDVARYRADGEISFVDRADRQIKLRGHRIEPGEIEAALRRQPAIRDAAVLLREDTPGDRRLTAYIVSTPGSAAIDTDALQRALRTQLPDVMVPTVFVPLSALPLSPSAKIDRRQLPAPTQAPLPAGRVAPRTQAEEIITTVWAEVLGLTEVGVDDNFLELGGHSLNAIQVLVRLREIFGREIELNTLFTYPTPATLAPQLVTASGQGLEAPPLEPVARDRPLPVSFGQERLWIVDEVTGTRPYHVPLAMRVDGPLDPLALTNALRALTARHEVLRTAIEMFDDRLVQRIASPPCLDVLWIDVSGPSGLSAQSSEQAGAIARLRARFARASFTLNRPPLWRVAILRFAPDRHLICCTLHHIIADGWSIGILLRDVVALYEAASTGESPRVPPLPVQYADYAAWQRRTLTGDRLALHLDYWRTQLADAPPLALPTDRPRPAIASGRGALVTRAWPAALSGRVQRDARQHGATTFIVLLAAWQALLARYAGARDIAVGVPVAQRPRPELEGLIGFFLNTLVMRTTIARRASWRTLVAQVRAQALAAYAHQLVPFEQVIGHLQPERDLARAPLFQVMFVLQNYPSPRIETGGLRFAAVESGGTGVKFDLELTVDSRGLDMTSALQYAVDLFDPSTPTRMLEHLERLIDAAIAAPDAAVEQLPLLTPAEQSQMLQAWTGPLAQLDGDGPLRIDHRISTAAAAVPSRLAVVAPDGALRYGDLEARSNRLARHLRRRGVGRDQFVAVLSDRSTMAVVGFLGIMKAGAAYVPLAPDDPPERLRAQVQDLGSRLVLCERALSPALAGSDVTIVLLDAGAWEEERSDALTIDIDGDDLAYALFTSGSTGQPKAVMVPHRALVNYTQAIVARLAVPAAAAWQFAIVSALHADLANTPLYAALTTGGTVHLVSRADSADPQRFASAMRSSNIDVLKIVPAHLTALMAGGDADRDLLPREWVVLGGEPLGCGLATRLHDYGVRVLNEYGPTETTVGCVDFDIDLPTRAHVPMHATVPIGRPIANVRVSVRDATGGLTPTGVAGELCIGGAGVARGYWREPARTASRFVPDPDGPPGSRLYRSGDLVRADSSGQLTVLGRRDDQVKLHGHRVELGEIEAALRQHPSVRQAAVLLREDAPGDRRLVAYVAASDEASQPLGETLQRHLRDRLPSHMVPAVVMTLPTLPLNANGKIDRRRLPAPGHDRPRLTSAYAAPRTAMEMAVAQLWRDVLHLDRVGIHDNFFALGGDSITAIQLAHRARGAGLAVTPLLVFQHQSIAELIAHLDADTDTAEAATAPAAAVAPTAEQLVFLSSRVQIQS